MSKLLLEAINAEHGRVVTAYVPFEDIVRELRGLMEPGDRLDRKIRELDDEPRDPFA